MSIEAIIQTLTADRREPLCAYLYDLNHLRAHVQRTIALLPEQCRFFYAIKANSESPILRAVAPLVHGFEVASLGEIAKVRAVSASAPIIFGGPGKTDAEITSAICQQVTLLHVESGQELRRVQHLAAQRDVVVPILLRVNLRGPLPAATLQMAGAPTQFGIDEHELPGVIALARHCPNVEIQGFHLHSLSNNLDADAHVRLIAHYIDCVHRWATEFRLQIRVLNVGGGIGVNYMQLDRQFDWQRFTSHLRDLLADEPRSRAWTLLFECGRYVTAACGYYAAEVLDIKRNHGTEFVIVRGGTQHFRLPVSWQHNHPFTVVPIDSWSYPFPRREIRDTRVTVTGQLCTPKDVFARDVLVPRMRIGDVLLFVYAGAYGWSISHHDFLSHPHPEHLFLDRQE
jgi:diaminopimelate decarboxylase